jgi:tripartite-type tricarboxylate transporter receptor subunit TctC
VNYTATLAGFALLAHTSTVMGQVYPTRPIRIVVPFVAGGATDIVSRALGQRLSESTGQPIIVDNRGGAGGAIGSDIVAKAAPDGYTFLMATAANAANATLVRNLPHDLAKDFAPVTLVVMSPYLLIVHPSVAKSVADLIAQAKARPGSLNYASSGNGSSQHLTSIMFDLMAGTTCVHIPYKGAGAAFTDLISGQVQMLFSAIPGALPHVRAGKLRALAVSSAKRSAGVPDIPTVSEAGVPGFDMSGWYGLLAPSGAPAAFVTRINNESVKALANPDLKELLVGLGLDPIGNTSVEYGRFISAELQKYAKLTKAAGLKKE